MKVEPSVPAALRTLVGAVDERESRVTAVLQQGWRRTEIAELCDIVETMARNVLHHRSLDDGVPSPAQAPAIFAVGVAVTARRLEHATPFREGGDTQHRQTHIDVEQPLLKNPGRSAAVHRLRAGFQDTLASLFDQHAGVRRLVARVLLPPTGEAPRFTTDDDAHASHVTLGTASGGEYVRLPSALASRWVRIVPEGATGDVSAAIRRDDESVFVPVAVLRAKFRAYAGHGFDRLVHRGFHEVRDWRRAAVKRDSWGVEKAVHDKYRTNNIRCLYGDRRYDTAGASTASAASRSPGFRPLVHNHHLVNIVDVIRGTESLSFDAYVTASELYDAARRFFPAAHRPSLTLNSVQRVAQVLRSASETTGETAAVVDRRERQRDGRTVPEYRITPPRYTPFYTPPPDEETVHRWDAYRRVRAQYTESPLGGATELAPGVRAAAGTGADPLVDAKRRADALAAGHAHNRPLEAIDAAVRPAHFDVGVEVTHSELRVLTRIVHVLNGLVQDRTLIDGMAGLTKTPDGDVVDALLAKELLQRHEAGYHTVYSVPSAVVDALGLDLLSHETFGEKGAETGLHRYGTALLAAAFAQRAGVDTVRRYVDLWRFDADIEAARDRVRSDTRGVELGAGSLDWRRVDVVAFSDGDPVYVGEVQLSQKAELVRRNWVKLRLLAEQGADAVWLTANFHQLTRVIHTLQDEGCVAAAALPTTDRVSIWQQSFNRKNLYNEGIEEFHTLRSLYREVDIA